MDAQLKTAKAGSHIRLAGVIQHRSPRVQCQAQPVLRTAVSGRHHRNRIDTHLKCKLGESCSNFQAITVSRECPEQHHVQGDLQGT